MLRAQTSPRLVLSTRASSCRTGQDEALSPKELGAGDTSPTPYPSSGYPSSSSRLALIRCRWNSHMSCSWEVL